MINSRKMDGICIAAICLAVFFVAFLTVGCLLFADKPKEKKSDDTYISTDYVTKIFDDTYVHEIDIVIPDINWDYMVEHATEEQYVICDLIIDGEMINDVAIRPKGNSSLSAIKAQDSDRFSFKIEFDHYKKDHTYYGLDKLALNNLGQDVSCMKDFLTYHMMNEIGVAAPLSSFVMIKLNGEDFGLYLAVEAIEDSFAKRNYGDDYGNIYKPECFEMANVTPKAFINTEENPFEGDYSNLGPGDRVDLLGTFIRRPFEASFGENMEVAALKYVGDDESNYSVMFDFSVFDITKADKESYIKAVKCLNSSENPQKSIDVDSVIRYLAVHNFVNNYDSYSGVFVHNYYIRESNGKLSMIPWDYNLAFGIFTLDSAMKSIIGADSPYMGKLEVGDAMSDDKSMVNYPIDTPTITVELEDRPLIYALLSSPEYLDLYHETYDLFLNGFFESGRFENLYKHTEEIIEPYVASGQTFYEYEDVKRGSKAVHDYCVLRNQSIRGQLDGTIPATMEGQSRDFENLVEADDLNLYTSVNFDSLVFGICADDIIEILDAVAGDNEHNSEGFEKSIEAATKDSKEIGRILGRVLKESSLVKRALSSVLTGPFLLIVSFLIIGIALKRVKLYSRRKTINKE